MLGDYKELQIIVENVDKNSVGITTKDLERTLKLRLMRGGFSARIDIELSKSVYFYISPDHGATPDHIPSVFRSGGIRTIVTGSTKSFLLESVETVLDDFILKYLEANME